MMQKLAAAILTLASVALLAATAPPHAAPRAIDPAHSTLTVYAYKTGLFAFAADNHQISAPITGGTVDEAARSVTLSVDARGMRVLDPNSPRNRDQVQANMLGPKVLDTAKYPTISFRSTGWRVDSATHFTVTGDLTLHGRTHEVLVNVDRAADGRYTGNATVKQTDFGITPITIAGGAVRVKDEVRVEFAISPR